MAVQHHPSRAHLLPSLLAQLGDAEVVTDPDPTAKRSAWRTYRRALELTPGGATHRLILQDDAEPCRNFRAAVLAAVAARPEALVAFFHGDQPRENRWRLERARRDGSPWAELDVGRWVPVVALCWPAAAARAVPEFVAGQNWPHQFTADDEIVGRYARAAGLVCYATCPSLVEHGEHASVGRPHHGALEGRRADWFIGTDDPLAIGWG